MHQVNINVVFEDVWQEGDDILFDRVTYPAINKGALDTYVMTFELTLKEGTVV